jgi:hypothetical protein
MATDDKAIIGWKAVFADFKVPAVVDDLVAAGVIEDASCQNYIAPRFTAGTKSLWVHHGHFCVTTSDGELIIGNRAVLFEGDDIHAALGALLT